MKLMTRKLHRVPLPQMGLGLPDKLHVKINANVCHFEWVDSLNLSDL